jgi:hypothetical protein
MRCFGTEGLIPRTKMKVEDIYIEEKYLIELFHSVALPHYKSKEVLVIP